MKSDNEIKELTIKLKSLNDTLKDTLNQIEDIADELGDENANRIVITGGYVRAEDGYWYSKDMSVWDWVGVLNHFLSWIEIEEANQNEQ